MVQSPDIREGFYYAPDTSGRSAFCHFSINSQGLRERELPRETPPGTTRILVSGDSLIFGAALKAEHAFPRFLERTLNDASGEAKYEVINAGIVGYNFTQEVAGLRRLVPHYRPDIVLIALIYNDTELQGISPMGWTPTLRNCQRDTAPRPNPVSRKIFRLLVPKNGERPSERLRYSLANLSRLYLFTALRFNSPYPPYMRVDRELALFRTPGCQSERIFWERFRANLEELKRLSAEYKFEPVIVFYMDILMEGLPVNRMRGEIENGGFRLLDLSYLWKDQKTYVRKYSLGWDHHPNRAANRLAARTTAGFLASQNIITSNDHLSSYFNPKKYREAIESRRREHLRLEREQAGTFQSLARKFSSQIDFQAPDFSPDQLLYGWWEEDFSEKMGDRELRWTILEASAFLGNPDRKRLLLIDGEVPGEVIDSVGTYTVGVSFNCGEAQIFGPFKTGGFSIEAAVPETELRKNFLEVSITSDVFTTPARMGVDPGDLKVVALGIRRLRLR